MLARAAYRTVLTLTVLATCIAAAPVQQRTGTDGTGKFSVEGTFTEAKLDSVVLEKRSGSVIAVPVARLSETDRQYLQTLAEEPSSEPIAPAPEVIAAWRKAKAEFGWISQRGDLVFVGTSSGKKRVAGDLPAFRFWLFPAGKLAALPPPEVP